MPLDNQMKVLVERTESILYYAEFDLSKDQGAGWIGGNAPQFFDDQDDLIHEGNQKYLFYLSLVHPFKPESMISIFIPEDYEEYLKNNMYPNCSIKVIEHPISTESIKEMFTNPGLKKHTISDGTLSNDQKSMDQSFLFQVDEDGYPETLVQHDYNYPFGFGSLYIFAMIRATEIQHPVAGFWQFS